MTAARIFLSYRREDSAGHAGRLYDRLSARFGPEQVFRDVEIQPGADFVELIQDAVSSCRVLIAVIGPRWLRTGLTAEQSDLVHAEIQTALELAVDVIPVLVDGAWMPAPRELPEGIRRLARLNAIQVSDDRFESDVARLLDWVETYLAPAPIGPGGGEAEATEAGPPPERSRQTRKTVTVLFTDIAGYTALGERLDAEVVRRIQRRFFEQVQAVIEHHGGVVEDYAGDAVMSVFGLPTLHEDDAVRASRAATEFDLALAGLNAELGDRWGIAVRLHTGIATGEVVSSSGPAGQHLVTGAAVNTASRLESAAAPDEILIDDATRHRTRGAVDVEPGGALELKGKAEPVTAWRLTAVTDAGPPPRWPAAPVIGRTRELELLHQAYERSVRDRSCHLVTVIGAAGVGKSRLCEEFVRGVADRALVLRGRCLAYGEGITFWPLGQVVKSAAGIEDTDPPEVARTKLAALASNTADPEAIGGLVAGLMALEPAVSSTEEVFWAVRRLLEAIASRHPVVVLLEDIHWAEPTLLDLIEYLADWCRDAPIILLCPGRNDLLDRRPRWGGGKSNAATITLEPLSPDQSEILISKLVGGSDLPPSLVGQIVGASDGNPLFVEEMMGMLVDDGVLQPGGAGWVAVQEAAGISVPATITALLAARLDRLEEDGRDVLERAAIVGQEFYLGAVTALSPPRLRRRVALEMSALMRRDLIRPVPSTLRGEEAFRFRHVLIRDAAYQGLPKEDRADLHERFAGWLERVARERIPEFEEILGYHLEQAHGYRLELGLPEPGEDGLAARAAGHLAEAGRRAAGLGDGRAAVNLLSRAETLLPPEHRDLAPVRVALGAALFDVGDFARADEILAATEAAADPGLAAHARLERLWIQMFTDPQVDHEAARGEIERMIPAMEGTADQAGLTRAWSLLVEIEVTLCRAEPAERAALQAVECARKSGDRRLEMGNLGLYSSMGVLGPAPVSDARARCQEVLDDVRGDIAVETWIQSQLVRLDAMEERFDEGRTRLRQAKATLEDIGHSFWHAGGLCQGGGFLETLAGDLQAAERELRWGFDILERMGETSYLSTTAAQLAHALFGQGRDDEAEEFTVRSEETAAPADVSSQVGWRAARAKVLARRGSAVATELAMEATELAERTDFLNDRAAALMSMGQVLSLLGRSSEARTPILRAIELYRRKGNRAGAAQAQGGLDELG
jgi:class 3 adenylate cyclase/tetratricopeptide (TPR) repeat protein